MIPEGRRDIQTSLVTNTVSWSVRSLHVAEHRKVDRESSALITDVRWIQLFPKLIKNKTIRVIESTQDRCLSAPTSTPQSTNLNTNIVYCGSNLRPVSPLYSVKMSLTHLYLIWNDTLMLIHPCNSWFVIGKHLINGLIHKNTFFLRKHFS